MMISHPRRLLGLLALVALLAAGVLAAPGAHAARRARRAARTTTCDVTSVATTLGPTSVSSLKVTGVSCATGKSVVRAFHACRLRNGVSGRCVRYVQGYACGEIRTGSTPQFTSRVTCRNGRRTVVHSYTQVVA